MKKIVVLSGAGISAESGIATFRDSNGLWENHDVMEVASPEGWCKDQGLVLNFYNQRRRQLHEVEPNDGHRALVKLEEKYEVAIVTQNIDDLHERAGSKSIIHLHGQLLKARSTRNPNLVYDWPGDITSDDKCEEGSQLRPHIVWFGEDVPMLQRAAEVVYNADIVIIVGTSMNVYPAASLVGYARTGVPVYYIDPNPTISFELTKRPKLEVIKQKGGVGIPELVERLMREEG
ncbi:MAG: NAD-dependent deacetylase [Polaribacter sp.]|jgi:NAD-dependent deacetylase